MKKQDHTAYLNFHSRITTIPCALDHNPLRFEEKFVLPIRELPRSFTSGSLTAGSNQDVRGQRKLRTDYCTCFQKLLKLKTHLNVNPVHWIIF